MGGLRLLLSPDVIGTGKKNEKGKRGNMKFKRKNCGGISRDQIRTEKFIFNFDSIYVSTNAIQKNCTVIPGILTVNQQDLHLIE